MEIKTGRGTKLRIKPPLEYSEDFEPYESMSTERNSDDPLHYSQVGLHLLFVLVSQLNVNGDKYLY